MRDTHVGKSCIIRQFVHGTFDRTHQFTIGVDFLAMNLKEKTVGFESRDTTYQDPLRAPFIYGILSWSNRL